VPKQRFNKHLYLHDERAFSLKLASHLQSKEPTAGTSYGAPAVVVCRGGRNCNMRYLLLLLLLPRSVSCQIQYLYPLPLNLFLAHSNPDSPHSYTAKADSAL